MSPLDWAVLVGTVVFISAYGAWKTRGPTSARAYLKGEGLRWPTIGLSIMATQASAITFLSVPGQAYEDGLRFVQFYFGLPLAMVIISAVFVPIYHRLQVVTAYEFLEQRFDVRVRVLAATLFMIGRGLAAGITIYAPSIVLSAVLGWSIDTLNLLIGGIVVLYTVTGGARAVSQTQKQQMIVMMGGIVLAALVIAWRLPGEVTLGGAATLAGALGKLNAVDFSFDPSTRYTFWSGITGGLFLSLSYFGTDQSQVGRYLGGASVAESRLGLLFNGMLKIPMQALILAIGVLVFVFYVFERPPVFFDQPTLERVRVSEHAPALEALEVRWDEAFVERREQARAVAAADTVEARAALVAADQRMTALRGEARELVKRALPGSEVKDSDHIFVGFVLRHLPKGLVGLLMAVIVLASMSSTASELNALGSTSVVDLYKRLLRPYADETHTLLAGKAFTVFWGALAIGFATFAALVDNLIQAVNLLGSIFYGVILGIFLVAFFLRRVGATPVLVGAVVAQASVVGLYLTSDIGFLWFNVIGCALVVAVAVLAQVTTGGRPSPSGGEPS